MTEEEFQRRMIQMMAGMRSDMNSLKKSGDRLEAAVFGNPEQGVNGLLTDVAIIKDKTPGKVKRVGINGVAGAVGSILTIVATVLSGKVG